MICVHLCQPEPPNKPSVTPCVQNGLSDNFDTDISFIRPKVMGEPTIRCAPMHIIAKKTGKPRRVVDFQILSQAFLRQTHPTKAPLLQCQSVQPYNTKTILDAWNGYPSMSLQEEDRHLTTIITPWGTTATCPKDTWQPTTPTRPATTRSPKDLSAWSNW